MGTLYNAEGFRDGRVEVAYLPEDATTCACVRLNSTVHRADELELDGDTITNGIWSVTLD
jgi:hypothetical protein